MGMQMACAYRHYFDATLLGDCSQLLPSALMPYILLFCAVGMLACTTRLEH